MNKLLPYLFGLCGLIVISPRLAAQCGYSVTLHTNNGYCVGSSLIATSPHALQKITWYRNGQPVATVTGSQFLSTHITRVPIFPPSALFSRGSTFDNIGTDDAGNIYVLFNSSQVLKATPTGVLSTILQGNEVNLAERITCMDVDPAGNIYLGSYANSINTGVTSLIWKVPAGKGSTSFGKLATAVPIGAIPMDTLPISADFVDCQNNIYIFCPLIDAIYRYTPGTAIATHLGGGAGNAGCRFDGGFGCVYTDPVGNIFFEAAGSVMKLLPGANAPVTVVPFTCQSSDNSRYPASFWIDGGDTVYLTVVDDKDQIGFVEKWAPGATTAQRLESFSLNRGEGGILPITMDARGNLLLAYDGDSIIYKYERTTAIDSAFTPTDAGTYYAVVTDIRGYTTTSDTVRVDAPSASPPSIRITATATSTPVCTPITFTAQTTDGSANSSFQWEVSGVPEGGDSSSYSYNLFANGDDVYCIMTTQEVCAGLVSDTSNLITLSIDPHGAASVTISTPKDSICEGDTPIFTASVTNGSSQPVFEWLVNGDSTGDNSAVFDGTKLPSGDVITCLITSDDVCGLAKSNSISLTISIPPTVESGQIYTIPYGHSLTLVPKTTGDIGSWRWTPATGLSDTSIADPVASPDASTVYTLTVTSPGGCSASGTILVNVYTPISIPGAFTPNGDGHNDAFYVLGGPVNSEVEDFAVFNRFGAEVFHVHDVAPGDRIYAWNGTFHGTPAPAGTYVYFVLMKLAGGIRQQYKGTVVLTR